MMNFAGMVLFVFMATVTGLLTGAAVANFAGHAPLFSSLAVIFALFAIRYTAWEYGKH